MLDIRYKIKKTNTTRDDDDHRKLSEARMNSWKCDGTTFSPIF